MRAGQLTRDDCGKRIIWQDKHGRRSIILGHLHIEHTTDGPDLILVRAAGADPWDAYVLDARRKVSVEP